MEWYEIKVKTTSEGTDLIADAFFSIGCLGGVKIMDKNDILETLKTEKFWDYVDENLLKQDEYATVSGFVSIEEFDEKLAEFKEFTSSLNYPVLGISVDKIDDVNWYENWKKHYAPIEIGKYVIIPNWLEYKKEGFTQIRIDPGMAFGTGEHESTKMCLKLMSDLDFTGLDVIDVGTGSGILGIAAMLSKAKSCYMCDIDSIAVTAAKENAKINKVNDLVEIENADLLTKKDKKADVVLANLTASILKRLSIHLKDHMKENGKLICSGIINSLKDEVMEAFISKGFKLEKELNMGEWNGLMFSI